MPCFKKNLRANRQSAWSLVIVFAWLLATAWALPGAQRVTLNFDPDWKFLKADPANAFQIGFDDRDWTSVSLPHTYNDVDTFENFSLPGHRGEQNQWGGRTWYRKTFSLPSALKGKKVFIEFQAARQVADVYLNGHFLGTSKTGFIPFGFDLTPWLRFDATNVLAVMCDNRFMRDPATEASLSDISKKVNAQIPDDVNQIQADQIPWNNPHWHPAHGGLYRNVYLYVTDPLHISLPLYSFLQTAGPYVYATDVTSNTATVHLEVPVENGRSTSEKIEVEARVLDRNNQVVLTLRQSGEVAAGTNVQLNLSGVLNGPQLWEPATPNLYHVAIALHASNETVDTGEVPLGIRTVHWDTQTGFWINDHHLKLHGWGQKPTDEWPGLGAAQPDWLHYYTLSLMKDAGGNWIRWGHCAAAEPMITAGDELGIMAEQPGVDGESDTTGAAWKIRAAAWRDTIIYFRNHPSILIWEGGNQKLSLAHARELRGYMDKFDPHGGRAYAQRRADQADAQFMDVCIGTEGGHEIASLPVVEGEYDREESPRRIWDDLSPPNFGYQEAKGKSDYVLTSEQFAADEVAQYVQKLGADSHCGGANWIFSDSTSGGRDAVEVTRASGEVDGERLPKEAYYVCQVMFRSDPQIHIIGHWNYSTGIKKTVYVASNCGAVELFLNDKSLGRGDVSNGYLFTFNNVIWEPGEIKAVGYQNGQPIISESKHTVGEAVALKITPLTGPHGFEANGSDIALLDVEAVDANGERCPTFQRRVDFDLSGPGIWRGGYNSGKTNSINQKFLDLECGINRVAVRSTDQAGDIRIRAQCDSLKPATLEFASKSFTVENGYAYELPPLPSLAVFNPLAFGDTHVPSAAKNQSELGRFLSAFSYSGPTTKVCVQKGVQDGAQVYADRDYAFNGLPAMLQGCDWVQTANADKLYSAVDLLNFALKTSGTVYVAHDARLPEPEWLQRQFQPVDVSFKVNGQDMKIFMRSMQSGESLTLGSNTEDRNLKSCNMYLVFLRTGQAYQASR